jgi:hypothetical protein
MVNAMHKIFYSEKTNQWLFWCPACDSPHEFDKTWTFNGDLVNPTVTPSLLVTGGINKRCHFFITDGKLQYCEDSHHPLAGETVEIPVWNRIGDY